MAVRTRTQAELMARFEDLVIGLREAAQRFDQGGLLEARTLADHIRSLVHTSPASRALIRELGLQDKLTWVDTAGALNPKVAASAACLTLMKIRTGSQRCGEYVPKLGLYPPAPIRTRDGGRIDSGSRIPFDHWWTNPVIKDADGVEFSRRQLVLALASDSADPDLAAARRALARSTSLGCAVRRSGASAGLERNPVMASVRQIGYEVLQSIHEQRDVIDARS